MCEPRKTIGRWTTLPIESFKYARHYRCTIWQSIWFALEISAGCQGWHELATACNKIGKWGLKKKTVMFTREILNKCPKHDHGCGLPHVDGTCARDALVSAAMRMTEEDAHFSEQDSITRIHILMSSLRNKPVEVRQNTWLEIAGVALRQAVKEPEKSVPIFPAEKGV